jgi:hypothetical protein
MIIYDRGWASLLTLRFGRGSPLTRNLLVPALSVLMTAMLFQYTCKHVIEPFGAVDGVDEEIPFAGVCTTKWSLHPGPVRCASGAASSLDGASLTRRLPAVHGKLMLFSIACHAALC